MSRQQDPDAEQPTPSLFVVNGDASPEEVAALVAVLQATAGAAAGPAPDAPRPEWSAPYRRLRASLPLGPAGWRSSALPR